MMAPTKTLSEDLEVMAVECLAVRVRILNRAVSVIFDDCLREFGLRVNQGNILVAIARRGQVKPVEICRCLRIEKSTFSRDVEVLRRQGWVESESSDAGRTQTLAITKKGSDLLRRIKPAWDEAQQKTRELIGSAGVDAVYKIAERIGFESCASR